MNSLCRQSSLGCKYSCAARTSPQGKALRTVSPVALYRPVQCFHRGSFAHESQFLRATGVLIEFEGKQWELFVLEHPSPNFTPGGHR